ncbi:hypothetical protein BG004_000435 [Podila humilis]|nr:hypothetical protein BG004_000435 [Podila humilis]
MADANSTELEGMVEEYDLGLHIGCLFANMAASALGVLLPILFSLTSFSPRTTSKIQSVIQTTRTFGSGVILATAFIHMLPSAFSNLSDPSLPWQFQEEFGYTGWPGLIAMLAAMLLHLLEFTATQRFFSHEKEKKFGKTSKPHHQTSNNFSGLDSMVSEKTVMEDHHHQHHHHHHHHHKRSASEKNGRESDSDSLDEGHAVTTTLSSGTIVINLPQEPDSRGPLSHVHGGDIVLTNKRTQPTAVFSQNEHHDEMMLRQVAETGNNRHSIIIAQLEGEKSVLDNGNDINDDNDQENRLRMIGTFILEFGLALHSVIIGIALGTTVGTGFVSLFVALLFHQFFEGVALGGRIASIHFDRRSLSPWLLSAGFALSTPVGVALGIGIRQSYDGESVTSLLVQGVFDSLSAGILLYTAMVQLMSTELNTNVTFRQAGTRWQTIQFLALWCGAAAMAIIGKWA